MAKLKRFESIYLKAAQRKGGEQALEELLPSAKNSTALRRVKDDRVLAEMTACVFRSGFVWQIIEKKWPGFEDAFAHFDVSTAAMLSDEDLERLVTDERIVRNAKKIASVPKNAAYILDVRAEHGSFGRYLAAWPADDIVGLWDELKTRGNRLGGQTGRYFLRFIGKDTPVLSPDVVKALVEMGVVDKEPTSKKAQGAVQDAFNNWHAESGRELCQISRVLACSVP
ncbi:MAG: DNA-3-methyladenine glycosylase I [Pseudomonadales bacterium]|jgi:3-methyladenine DNA glycosylase Tag|nr:DNA-3-methyladenine glycosylase I [Pseudomonadales bacterium]MDP6470213.1 DNA-3-methyladenine glycosylase I [Pseudomonadales bacterium]MDP6827119.1 DNA-3-methyladenine glycosylase I [Pseudomonadales bacterium]MDP6971557.1 DNA-3-methyladenine glycosylase I [Pseudomonadales bacterium]|tara:strand:- start:2718 stop:3395 length:678 start_codon:yes stop_codon:yes gene_type:complete